MALVGLEKVTLKVRAVARDWPFNTVPYELEEWFWSTSPIATTCCASRSYQEAKQRVHSRWVPACDVDTGIRERSARVAHQAQGHEP